MSVSFWNTPERLALLERTCGLPEWLKRDSSSWRVQGPGVIEEDGTCSSIFWCVLSAPADALVRDHAAEWLDVEHGIHLEWYPIPLRYRKDPTYEGSWRALSNKCGGIASGGTRDEAIEAALRWISEQGKAAGHE